MDWNFQSTPGLAIALFRLARWTKTAAVIRMAIAFFCLAGRAEIMRMRFRDDFNRDDDTSRQDKPCGNKRDQRFFHFEPLKGIQDSGVFEFEQGV
ncbi:MAG: hypothetical protein A3I66_13615 [Burkholderiales bacterium RIFCSPLOWO2_02_FULL_57_36]|nr:MAG: hypothetical protein A3I66_13615 [Burkholderiales bacterium RIFCSPLOWO2_02_FULL_57_36]